MTAPGSVRVKICCISTLDEAKAAVAAGADVLGLVTSMPSGPGVITDELAVRIARWAPPGVATFLLTAETEPAAVVEQVRRCGTTAVQLVDRVAPGTWAALRRELPNVRVAQVVHMCRQTQEGRSQGSIDDGPRAEAVAAAPHVDAILLDSGSPDASIPLLGGTGRVHNWDLSAEIVRAVSVPVYLAGGLRPDNVRDAVDRVRPFGLDVCSGVREGGRLSPSAVRSLIQAVRA